MIFSVFLNSLDILNVYLFIIILYIYLYHFEMFYFTKSGFNLNIRFLYGNVKCIIFNFSQYTCTKK